MHANLKTSVYVHRTDVCLICTLSPIDSSVMYCTSDSVIQRSHCQIGVMMMDLSSISNEGSF